MALNTGALPVADARPRRVTILGSTGSVGCNTVDLILLGHNNLGQRLFQT